MIYIIEPLTPSVMREHLAAILEMDSSIVATEHWEQSHFLVDLPGKWECSRVVLNGEKLTGFMIATYKPESVHVNRIAIAPQYQSAGIAMRLLKMAALSAQHSHKQFVTLKVSLQNKKAVGFYQHRGFQLKKISGSNLALYIEAELLLAANEADR